MKRLIIVAVVLFCGPACVFGRAPPNELELANGYFRLPHWDAADEAVMTFPKPEGGHVKVTFPVLKPTGELLSPELVFDEKVVHIGLWKRQPFVVPCARIDRPPKFAPYHRVREEVVGPRYWTLRNISDLHDDGTRRSDEEMNEHLEEVNADILYQWQKTHRNFRRISGNHALTGGVKVTVEQFCYKQKTVTCTVIVDCQGGVWRLKNEQPKDDEE